MAIGVPVEDGYVSVQVKPSSRLLADVKKKLYAELAALEREVEDGDPRQRKAAIAASSARLEELLAGLGFASYDEFVRPRCPPRSRAGRPRWRAGGRT
ncbi:MAG TPA: hypothetical protein VN213_08390, partial [Solirubrobacteraceae bacterium]|nr:hypothetical protein [Solirubrobacteraceae bacterium]